MYNIKFESYVPEPSPAKSDRIVAAHYYAAWKYGAAKIHNGFDDLAEEWPDRTPLMGYYDEENPEVCDWEIKWALEHGINCFIYCWYRNLENMGKPVTVNDLRCGHGIHEALFNAKYGDMMNFAIMFEASPRWGGTDKDDLVQNLMPFWTETYFKRDNYLKIDNKPVLFVYQQQRLGKECFKDNAEQRAAFDACREYAKKHGFDGMIFAANKPGGLSFEETKAVGYDFTFCYNSQFSTQTDMLMDDEIIIKGQLDAFKERLEFDPKYYIPTPSCFNDYTPRTTKAWIDKGYKYGTYGKRWYLSPEGYRKVLEGMKEIVAELPEDAWAKKIIMIDNWNEWDEGHFVAPSHKFGYKYLQAIREVFTERNNLPDYRTPHDQGFTGYNKSWKTPDFKEFCEKKLK
ncbi:MAG: glycoside hydrolase family 99-like domain-containing protein [Clostridia bacterium]|nr:glycoside hydrolase family 99-like domain-containing protein [Clostridia bacterium]